AVGRRDWPSCVGRGYGLRGSAWSGDAKRTTELSRGSPIKRSRRIQIDGAINAGQLLMHEISAQEKSLGNLALNADGCDLATRIIEFVRIIRQLVEVQTEAGELGRIELSLARSDSDVARRQLRSRHQVWIYVNRHASQ